MITINLTGDNSEMTSISAHISLWREMVHKKKNSRRPHFFDKHEFIKSGNGSEKTALEEDHFDQAARQLYTLWVNVCQKVIGQLVQFQTALLLQGETVQRLDGGGAKQMSDD